VRCPGPAPWKVYLTARYRILAPVVVFTRSLPKGETLGKEHLAVAERDITPLQNDYLTKTASALGHRLRQPVARGAPVRQRSLRTPLAVHRGQRVRIVAQAGGLAVSMDGIALADGTLGQLVKVRNRRSRKTLEAVVGGPGLVRVQL